MNKTSDVIVIQVQDGHVTLNQQFVYCWFHPHDMKILYVGATWMHPAARVELHLNGLDDNARIVGRHLAEAGIKPDEAMQVLAFSVPAELDRQNTRLALIERLAKQQMLSEKYFGPAPEAADQPLDTGYAEWIENTLIALKAQ